MNYLLRWPLIAISLLPLLADGQSVAPGEQPALAGTLAEKTLPTLAPVPAKLDVHPEDILETKVHEEGGRTITLQRIKPILLPEPPPPLPAVDITDPVVQARLAELRAKARKTEFVFVSATVYDHEKTFVRWWPNGRLDREIAGWINIDFNLFCGMARYSHAGREFSLLMGIGNIDTVRLGAWLTRRGFEYHPPVMPEFAEGETSFVVAKGDASAPGAMDVIDGLLAFYREDGERLELRREQRERDWANRQAWLKANPPQPKDIVLRYWRTGGKSVKPSTSAGR